MVQLPRRPRTLGGGDSGEEALEFEPLRRAILLSRAELLGHRREIDASRDLGSVAASTTESNDLGAVTGAVLTAMDMGAHGGM